uniref:Large ribosomal subunit protein bL20c n=1 Tax=Neodangemannia microcystis TaxID=173495 RepID=A0A1W6EHD4_9CHLO|nr:ribosomal protein L20 [Neodangemannia microcystis]ARK14776.1 ribosomal protein L20 [Neodangemannia microcystis]
MTRVKRGYVARKRRKKILDLTKGFRGSSAILFRSANQRNMKALKYLYRDRRRIKRDYRKLWITRINAATRLSDMSYSTFIHKLKEENILLNRKLLAQLAVRDQPVFQQLFTYIKSN